MTRDQAVQRITSALPQPADGTQLANDMAFAQRLVLALDALGLLHYAADRDLGSKLGHVGDEVGPPQFPQDQPPPPEHITRRHRDP